MQILFFCPLTYTMSSIFTLFEVMPMQSCELILSISTLACCIAQDRSVDELSLLAAIFSQLGDSLATIAAREALCSSSHSASETVPPSSH